MWGMGILEIRNVTLTFDNRVILDNLTIDFWEGHVHAVVGPNGAGKSTLARTIMGLSGYRVFDGDIQYQGVSIKNSTLDERARKGITLAWQEPARFEGISIRQYLSASSRGTRNEDAIKEILSSVGLRPSQYLDRAVDKTLSGGERKKVELASIVAMQPKVVVLDEPDSGIDIESLQRIYDITKQLKENGTTVILITHSLSVLEQAEHAFLMCCGKIVEKGATAKIGGYFKDKCIPCDHRNAEELWEV